MELSKLRKHSKKVLKNYLKLKYLSFGVILPPNAISTFQEKAEQMIDLDSCAHDGNTSQVLLTNFNNQLPAESGRAQSTNLLYTYFQERIREHFEDAEELPEDFHQGNKADCYLTLGKKYKLDQNFITIASKFMVKIYEEADKAHEIKKFRIAKVEKEIEKLLVQSHNFYLRLMELKSKIQDYSNQPTQSELTPDWPPVSCKQYVEEYDKINVRIAKLKDAISKKQEECKKLTEEEKNLAHQKIQFLLLLLKNGYHQSDGIWWTLAHLAKNDKDLTPNHFCDILDDITKQHLISEYRAMKSEQGKKKPGGSLPRIRESHIDRERQVRSRYQSAHDVGYPSLISISQEENSRRIYKEAQSYIVDWVRRERWKVRSLKHRPVQSQLQTPDKKDWRGAEIRRLKKVYTKQRCDQIVKYIFGSSKYLYKSTTNLFEEYVKARKESTSNHEATPSSAYRSVDHLSRNNTNN